MLKFAIGQRVCRLDVSHRWQWHFTGLSTWWNFCPLEPLRQGKLSQRPQIRRRSSKFDTCYGQGVQWVYNAYLTLHYYRHLGVQKGVTSRLAVQICDLSEDSSNLAPAALGTILADMAPGCHSNKGCPGVIVVNLQVEAFHLSFALWTVQVLTVNKVSTGHTLTLIPR